MKQIATGSFGRTEGAFTRSAFARIVSWNINRGQQLNGVIEFLAGAAADLILLQEADWNARRTDFRDVAREIARTLKLHYVFGCEFEELTQGRNGKPAYHGQVTLSRFPLSDAHILRFRSQSSFWRPRWFIPRTRPFQRRLGDRMALISCVDLPQQKLIAYNVHLESRGTDDLRLSQLREILNDLYKHPSDVQVVVAGDFNCDLRDEPAAELIGKSGLSNPFASFPCRPTTAPSRFNRSRPIDWILTTGPSIAFEAKLYDSVRTSDHYPLSLTLRWM